MKVLTVESILMALSFICNNAAYPQTVAGNIGEAKLQHFEVLDYPAKARLKQTQGAVVVSVSVDSAGTVVAATALSGSADLAPEALANAKKWRFQANSGRSAIILYHFKIQGLCVLPCRSQFLFFPPNLASIVIGEAIAES
jgi:TonB family protein